MDCKHNYIYTKGHFECTNCGHKKARKNQQSRSRKIGSGTAIVAIIVVVILLFSTQVLEINEENLDESLQNMPEKIQEVGITAKNLADETGIILRENIGKRLDYVKQEPVSKIVDDIAKIPKQIQEKNPLNEKPQIDTGDLEIQIHQITNEYRMIHGLETLFFDENLAVVARGHSQDMAEKNYFDHVSPEGATPTDRAKSKEYKCHKILGTVTYSGIGENIFQNNLYDTVWYVGNIPTRYDWNTQNEIAQSTVDGWMNSTGHRENILTENYDREGIGIVIASDDKVYITQNFC